MKTRNKVLIGGGIVFFFLVLGGYGLVSAHGPWSGPCGGFSAGFPGRGFQSEAFRKDMAEFIFWKMDKKAQAMNLTTHQKAKYETFRENMKSDFTEFQTGRQKMKDRFRKELSKETPDIPMVLESAKVKVQEMSKGMNKNLDLFLDFYNSLDNGQKAMVSEEIKKRMKVHQS